MKVLVIDPPWPQQKGGRRSVRPNQGKDLDYKTMSVDAIFATLSTRFNLCTESPTVFLWTIDKFLRDAEEQMTDRGFRLHARLVWDKGNGIAPAFTIRFTHEYLLWFYKRPMPPISSEAKGKLKTVFFEKSREHSRKPDIAYSMIEQMYPEAEKWDVFSREDRTGWQAWGDEVGKFS